MFLLDAVDLPPVVINPGNDSFVGSLTQQELSIALIAVGLAVAVLLVIIVIKKIK